MPLLCIGFGDEEEGLVAVKPGRISNEGVFSDLQCFAIFRGSAWSARI